MTLLDELFRLQGDTSDSQFAKQLGISRATWHNIRRGNRQMGNTVLARILNTFPSENMGKLVLSYVIETGLPESPMVNRQQVEALAVA